MLAKLHLIVFVFLLGFNKLYSQQNQDAGMWNTVTIQHGFTRKLSLVIDQEFRLRENYQRINLCYTNIGVDYKLNKNFKISPSYRFIQKKIIDNGYSFRHRLMLDLTIKKKFFKRLTISERARYQIEVADYNTSEKGKLAEQFLRFKTDFKYEATEKMSPYISCEFRIQLRDPKGKGPIYDGEFHRVRNVIGVEYKHSEKHSFNLYYLYQTEFNINTPESIYILGLGYTISI